jgi:hypothetical protein
MVGRRKVFVELLEDGRLLLEPEKDKLTSDEVRWLDEQVLPELRHERAKYENAGRLYTVAVSR